MGRKKEKKDSPLKSPVLKEETVGWIFAISFFAVFILSMLASVGAAGSVGDAVFRALKILFGFG